MRTGASRLAAPRPNRCVHALTCLPRVWAGPTPDFSPAGSTGVTGGRVQGNAAWDREWSSSRPSPSLALKKQAARSGVAPAKGHGAASRGQPPAGRPTASKELNAGNGRVPGEAAASPGEPERRPRPRPAGRGAALRLLTQGCQETTRRRRLRPLSSLQFEASVTQPQATECTHLTTRLWETRTGRPPALRKEVKTARHGDCATGALGTQGVF